MALILELEKQALEVKPFVADPSICTLRTYEKLAQDLGFLMDYQTYPEDLLDAYLRNKIVLDVGSGFNGLAIAGFLRGINSQITSINPAIMDPAFEKMQKREIALIYKPGSSAFSPEQIEEARVKSNTRTYPFFAHSMWLFPDGSFDVLIDNVAVSYYALRINNLLYTKSIMEMVRVTRPGGKIRIGSASTFEFNTPDWREQVLQDLGLNYTYHPGGVEIDI